MIPFRKSERPAVIESLPPWRKRKEAEDAREQKMRDASQRLRLAHEELDAVVEQNNAWVQSAKMLIDE